jgi:DNA-binding transcriptional regulator YiaG
VTLFYTSSLQDSALATMADETEFQGASAASAHSCRDKAFEIFVKRTITSIQKEAWGRSKEVKEIREACQVCAAAMQHLLDVSDETCQHHP